MKIPELYQRLIRRVDVDVNGCWLWQGATDPKGYGSIWLDSQTEKCHRAMWLALHGSVPARSEGLFVCHKCDTPACINPTHLWLGTPKDNVVDMIRKGRNFYAAKKVCVHGHEFTPENTYLSHRSNGVVERQCRACTARRQEKRRERRMA